MKTYKVGIVGLGGINRGAHSPFYAKDKRVQVVAICDILPDRAKKMHDDFYHDADIYTDYKELLKRDDLDAIDICTPNYLHSEIAIAALNAGINVFCEKPDAISPEKAQAMKDVADKNGKLLMIMRNNRFSDISKYAKKYIDDGRMGDIYAGRACWQRRRGIPGKGGWFTTKEQSGGGPLIDLGVHMLDLAIWLMGNPTPVAVSGATYCKFANNATSDSVNSAFGDADPNGTFDVEDLAMGFIRFDNGAVLQLEFSWASNVEGEHRFIELRGTKSGFTWKDGHTLDIYSEDGAFLTNTQLTGNLQDDGHCRNLEHFFDVLDGKAEPCFKPQQGIDMIKILDGIYRSAQSGREVVL